MSHSNPYSIYYNFNRINVIIFIIGKAGTKPSMKDLANEVIPRVCSKWRDLGLQFNIDHWVLDEIEEDHQKSAERCNRMLAKWLSQDAGASWSTLVAALTSRAVKETRLAESLEATYMGSHSS